MSAMPPTDSNPYQLERRNRELSVLNAIAQALNREVDLNQALQTTLAKAAELLGLDTGWVWLLDEHSGSSYLAATQNLPPALADHPTRMEGRCYCLDTFRAGDMDGAANVNVVTCSRLKWLVDGTMGLRYHASIPLYAQEKQLGVLNLASTDWRELSQDDLRLLHTIGDLLSIAIERARLFEESARYGALEERNRLAREIHDTLAQGLSAIALHLETADANLENAAAPGLIQESIRQALDATRHNLQEARRSVLDLRAAPLEGRPLAEALSSLIAANSVPGGPKFELHTTGAARPLPVGIEIGLYRIAQEALANIAKHAGAQKARLELITTPEFARLVATDDGRGFDPEQVDSGRFGLVGMTERARLLGGQLVISSAPGGGTTMEALIPLKVERKGYSQPSIESPE